MRQARAFRVQREDSKDGSPQRSSSVKALKAVALDVKTLKMIFNGFPFATRVPNLSPPNCKYIFEQGPERGIAIR